MGISKRFELNRLLTPAEGDNNFNWLKSDPPIVIINNGIITVDGAGWYLVDTEAGASSDILIRINGVSRGEVISLAPVSDSRQILVQPSVNLVLRNNAAATLNSTFDLISFRGYGNDICAEFPFR